MEIRDIIGFTRRAVLFHRLRSTLTALGIAIGVAAVVMLTSMGEGVNQFMVAEFSQFGTNNLRIGPGKPETLGIGPGSLNTLKPLTIEDSIAVKQLPYIVATNPTRMGVAEVEANGRMRNTMVFGASADQQVFFQVELAAGKFLPDDNLVSPRAVAIIGATLQEELYGEDSALGDRIRIGGSRFRVIGVLAPKGDVLGMNVDEAVTIPVAHALQLFNVNALMEIGVRYEMDAPVDEVVSSIRRLLKARHGFEDFNVATQQQMMEVLGSVLNVLTMAVAALGSISLFVGGVGIFTIMDHCRA